MSQIDLIRAEIEQRLKANGAFDEEGDSAWHYDQGLNDAYNYILSILSDLEKSEKPINPVIQDFPTTEKEMQDFLATHERIPVPERLNSLERILQEQPVNGPFTGEQIYNFLKEQPVCEGLEEEIERYLSTEWELDEDLNKDEPIYIYDCTWEDLKILARHFAQWGIKSQEKKIADAYEKGKQEGIRIIRSWESSPGQGGY